MRTGKGFLIVYDVTKRATFDEVIAFREAIYRVQVFKMYSRSINELRTKIFLQKYQSSCAEISAI